MAKRLKAEERRASILAVAKVLFADSGYHGVSIDEIAKRLAVSPAVLYQHFDSKENLYDSVLDQITCHRENYVEAILQGPDDFGSILLCMTKICIKSIAQDPDYLKMEMHCMLEESAAVQQFFESRWKNFADYIEISLQELAQEKRVNKTDPRTASLMFQGMLREILYAKCIYHAPQYKTATLDNLSEQMVQLFLKAINYQQAANG